MGVLPTLFWSQIQTSAPYGLLGRKLTPSQPKPEQTVSPLWLDSSSYVLLCVLFMALPYVVYLVCTQRRGWGWYCPTQYPCPTHRRTELARGARGGGDGLLMSPIGACVAHNLAGQSHQGSWVPPARRWVPCPAPCLLTLWASTSLHALIGSSAQNWRIPGYAAVMTRTMVLLICIYCYAIILKLMVDP